MEENRITKEELYNLKEDELMFITNPGRMGDVDGSYFIMNNNGEYKLYRVDGWYYNDKCDIKINDMFKVFPLWSEAWDKNVDNPDDSKYVFVPMGFGNGLCVDRRIYDKFYPYLLSEVKKQDMYSEEEGEDYNSCLNYPSWMNAVEKMIEDK